MKSVNVAGLLRAASRLRRSQALVRVEPLLLRLEPHWNAVFDRLSGRRGYPATVNADTLRLSYAYGARYEKLGYEPHLPIAEIAEGMVVIDIGAHVGLITLAAALRVGERGRVYAFEPAPGPAGLLRRHVKMNGWGGRVEILEAVVTEREGPIGFFVNGDTMSAALDSRNLDVLSPERFARPSRRIEVPGVRLDAFCESRGIVPDWIKIDVEGAEALVLRGSLGVLSTAATIVCEIHPGQLRNISGDPEEVESLLGSSGRTITRLAPPTEQGIYHVISRPRDGGG